MSLAVWAVSCSILTSVLHLSVSVYEACRPAVMAYASGVWSFLTEVKMSS